MVKVYFHEIKHVWDEAEAQSQLALLPVEMKAKISKYRSAKERHSRIIGKLMLLQLIKDFGLNVSLHHIHYSQTNKPILSPDFDFSIAHSGDIVICAATVSHPVGIDVEKIKPIDIDHYRDYLTGNEWTSLSDAAERQTAFYEIWTKKEAVLKASGLGVDFELNSIDVSSTEVILAGQTYFLSPVSISEGYIASLASSQREVTIDIQGFVI